MPLRICSVCYQGVRCHCRVSQWVVAVLQLIADSKFLQQESLVELVKAVVHAAGPLQRLSATPESMENAEVTQDAADDSGLSDAFHSGLHAASRACRCSL